MVRGRDYCVVKNASELISNFSKSLVDGGLFKAAAESRSNPKPETAKNASELVSKFSKSLVDGGLCETSTENRKNTEPENVSLNIENSLK